MDLLQSKGLLLSGGFMLDPEQDADLLRSYPQARQLVLIGNAGSAIWPHLKSYIDAHPNASDQLDQWTAETLQEVAQQIEATCLFPFGAAPYWPFQRWAQRAEDVHPSPISILIHPEYGLWHAYRGAYLLRQPIDLPAVVRKASPCDSCSDRPCLTTCPVTAFSVSGYDVEACATFIHRQQGVDCHLHGCMARRACPIGANWRYDPPHALFHMDAFLRAHPLAPQPGAI